MILYRGYYLKIFLNTKCNNYNIYKLLKIILNLFLLSNNGLRKKYFVYTLVLIYCVSPFNSNLLVLQSLWRFTHIRKNIIIYNKDRRYLTALQSTINCILVLSTCISIEIVHLTIWINYDHECLIILFFN